MLDARILLGGVLALAAVIAVASAIVAVAPYVAVILVGLGILYWFTRGYEEKPPGQENPVKPVKPPGE